VLHIQDLIKRYARGGAKLTALSGVSFEVRRGETLGLVGESGSGKSTLAKCVVGLVDPSGGEIELGGRALPAGTASRSHDLRRQIQMVFQNPDTALNPSHTVRRILGRAVRLLSGAGGQALDARVRELARAVNLSPRHLELRPASLSGGLKQRVAIARAFAGQPMLVLCDEPTSALDVSVQAVILNLLIDLQLREHVSYLFISHDLGLVGYIADRIAVMYLGEVVEIGPTDAVFDPPHHPYTEALLSAVATLDPVEGERIRLTGTIPSPFDRPGGCPFHTRCPRFLGEVCVHETPPWQQDAREHRYRCHIPPAELRDAQLQGRSLTTVSEE
jgi:peptide/nickel transport system ATP-binding protein